MIMNEREGTKYPQSGGTGENTPFAKQSRKKEQDKGHDTGAIQLPLNTGHCNHLFR